MNSNEEVLLSDRYRILRPLGEGGSSKVYLAEHLKLKTYRAIKCISKSHPLQSQFRLEADLLKSLSHPAIPLIYDIEEDNEYLYIIEEYVEGESLQHYMLYHDLISQEYIMQIGIRLCEVFIYLHGRRPDPVFYQDLKPQHIIVCGDSIRIIDFGIASYITSQGRHFQQFGTIGYAAPEQYTGEAIYATTDLYALGKVLEQLLGKSSKNYSKNLKKIIRKTVNASPAMRYKNAEQLKEALEQELNRVCPRSNGKGQTHLSYHIAVAGAKAGIGTTHIAAAVTAFCNQQKIPCIYLSMTGQDIVETLIRNGYLREQSCGIYQRSYFRAILPDSGMPECDVSKKSQIESYVLDYGSNLAGAKLAEADYTILVIGGNEWEQACALEAYETMKCAENLIVICNYNHRHICKKYAGLFQKRVYSFPFDADPFAVTKEKRSLFRNILQKERRRFYPVSTHGEK